MPQMDLAFLMPGSLEDGTAWGPQKTHDNNKIIVSIFKRVQPGLPYSSPRFSFWIPY